MKRVGWYFLKSLAVMICLGLFYLNIKLYYQPTFQEEQSYNTDVYHQLQFLKNQLQEGAGEEMQQLFPEGVLFLNALYSLAWYDFARTMPDTYVLKEEAIKEVDNAVKRMNQEIVKERFAKDQLLEYGAFYVGWTNYVLARKIQLQAVSVRDSLEIQHFQANCQDIARSIERTTTPYLTSYSRRAWPADMMLVIGSLHLHDQLFEPKYQTLIENWLGQVKERLDSSTELIPHEVDPDTGKSLESARGSSQSLILNFLYELDPVFAQQQFMIYRQLFLDSRLGLAGIREYPKDTQGVGDIDSGPVIWDIGGAASIVGQRTMGLYEDWTSYESLRNSIETFGVPYTRQCQKRYVFGQLVMADAFIVWSNALEYQPNTYQSTYNWRWKFQILCLLLFLALLKIILPKNQYI